MLNKLLKALLILLALALLASMAWMQQNSNEAGEALPVFSLTDSPVRKEEAQSAEQFHVHDNKLLYVDSDDTSVVTMYLTVGRGNAAENTNHSWKEINSYSAYDYDRMGEERYQIAALLQVGDENGPLPDALGYGETTPNATVQIRGQTSTKAAQKNYKIELKKGKGTWNDQRVIALNKHIFEGMRFRNKLAFDILRDIPQLMSLRTQFVHLYVRDLTGEHPDVFQDYGLYTQVEQPNARAMKAHGLNDSGHLYKINMFEFYRYEDVIRLQTDPLYDLAAFEERLEVKGNTDHTKLIQMLEALNDVSIGVDTLMEKHFDSENLAYWLAFEILIGNTDTQSRNVYIYSPLNSEKWYFLPWDHDGSFMRTEYAIHERSEQGGAEIGVSNYWNNVLFRRCLKSPAFRAQLDAAINDLRSLMTEAYIAQKVNAYAEVTRPYLAALPDQIYASVTPEEYEYILGAIPGEVEQNYRLYLESYERPMPFYIGVPVAENGMLSVNWDNSYDFDAETITYTAEIARDYLFEDVVYREETVYPLISMPLPEEGQYFVRVQATNEAGKSQYAFDYYVTDEGKAYGMRCFYVTAEGTVEVEVYEEG